MCACVCMCVCRYAREVVAAIDAIAHPLGRPRVVVVRGPHEERVVRRVHLLAAGRGVVLPEELIEHLRGRGGASSAEATRGAGERTTMRMVFW